MSCFEIWYCVLPFQIAGLFEATSPWWIGAALFVSGLLIGWSLRK